MIENLGSFRILYGTIDADRVMARLTQEIQLQEGETYDFSVRLRDLYYFDKEKGTRIRE